MSSIRLITPEDIKRFRKKLKLTQKQLAERAGLSQSLIARIENRSVDPRLSTVKKIIDIFAQTIEKRIASDVMHSPVITINSRESVRTAIDIMSRNNISQIPVLSGKEIIGSIREATIIDRIIKSGNSQTIFSKPVCETMDKKFRTVNPEAPIEEVVNLFSQGEPAILVAENNKILGIITKIDAISSTSEFKKN